MARKRFAADQWVTVEAINDAGQGLAQVGGYTLEIDNALPGEAVRVAVLKRRGRTLRCLALAVQSSHPDRIPALCPQAGRCGGCSQQHLSPEHQREAKQAALAALYEAAGVRPPKRWLAPLLGPVWGYRRKARLGVRYRPREGDVLVGFRERGGWVSKASSCPVLAPHFATLLGPLKGLIRSLSIPDQIPQLELAAGDEGAALVLRHLAPFTAADLDQLRCFAEAQRLMLYLQAGGPDTVTPLVPGEPPALTYTLPKFKLAFAFEPLDFTQVNNEINQKMVTQALALLAPTPGMKVLDLFCGLGNFTLPLARLGADVQGFEGSEALVARARSNAERNGLGAVPFAAADLYSDAFAARHLPKAEAVLLDPPRSGAEALCEDLASTGARRVVYVSCNPKTLARDAAALQRQGYTLEASGIMDMFPHTNHVESMALFTFPAPPSGAEACRDEG